MTLAASKLAPFDKDAFERFDFALGGLNEAFMIMDRDLVIAYANKAYLAATERSLDDLLGVYIFDAFPDTSERINEVLVKFLPVLDGKTTRLDDQSFELKHADGKITTRVWRAVQTPHFGPDGRVTHIIQRAADVTQEVEQAQRADVIAKELNHRVKNLLSIIQAIAELTGGDTTDIESYKEAFSDRLVALARTHAALSGNQWKGMTYRQILEDELKPYGAADNGRINIEGPEIRLTRRSSQDASLLTHEMMTNAAKHGCFSQRGGKLHVKWYIDREAGEFVIDWHESGLTGVTKPAQTGFGTALAETMPNLKVIRDFQPDGLKCQFRISLELASEVERG